MPAQFLREGRNDVLIAASNMWDNGGFFGGPERLFFETIHAEKIALDADWRYAIGTVQGMPPRAPWDANSGIGVIHNAMIAPLGRFNLAGVAWYQGEADIGKADYGERLVALFNGWRAQFGPQTRIMVVQLANFASPSARPAPSAWAELREMQRLAVLSDDNAALITAIDLGERTDIHPANKNDLGKRLALAAQGIGLPHPLTASRDDDRVVIRFSGVDGALEAWSGPHPLGVELCGDSQDSCRYAIAEIRGSRLEIPLDTTGATRVRYAWADSHVVNLYDRRGIAVPSFELTID